jgi:hypothetical protein
MRRPRFLRNYTPPTYDEMAAAIPDVDPARLARYYDLMCQAMRHKVYDRNEAFDRLRIIAESEKIRGAPSGGWTTWLDNVAR